MNTKFLAPGHATARLWLLIGAAMGVSLLWAYWTLLLEMRDLWANEPRHSHGFFVPLFSLALLWVRRHYLAVITPQVNPAGVVILGVAALLHLGGGFFNLDWIDGLSFLCALTGVCVLFGGWPALRWAWPALAFLIFMLPLPYRVEVALAQKLQWIATSASAYVLQTLGYPAIEEPGFRIIIDQVVMRVVRECNGLAMLLTFFALSTAVALLIDRPLGDRLIIVASAIPIAIVANVLRIVLTAILKVAFYPTTIVPINLLVTTWDFDIDKFFHDYAGYLMMPVALGLLWLELKLLDHLLPKYEPRRPVAIGIPGGVHARRMRPAKEAKDKTEQASDKVAAQENVTAVSRKDEG